MSAHKDVEESRGETFTVEPIHTTEKSQQPKPVGVVLNRVSFLKGIEIIANGIYNDIAGIDEERREVANKVVAETNRIHQAELLGFF